MGMVTKILSAIGLRSPVLHVRPGEIYSIAYDDNSYAIAKVLATDGGGVHVRIYSNRYPEAPRSIDVSTLRLGSIHDTGAPGLGHAPLTRRTFAGYHPVLLQFQNIEPDELQGYEYWKEAGGGYFGAP